MTIRRDGECDPRDHRLSRRRLLAGLAGAAAAAECGGLARLFTPAVAEELARRERQVLFIWLDGGISQLESWDPKPGTRFGGPFRAIPTAVDGIRVSELLPRTAKVMDQLALVRSLSTRDNSHSAGVARIHRGDPPDRGVVYPYFGSAVAKLLGPGKSGLPPYVWVKPGNGGFIAEHAGFLGAQFGALAFGDGKPPANLSRPAAIDAADDAERNELRERITRRYAARRRKELSDAQLFVFDSARALMERQEIFDASRAAASDVERYGSHDLGRHLLVARGLLEAGVRFVQVTSYGWDTHGDNFNGQASLVGKLDQSFAAIISDLRASGLLDHVLVIACSEFGRTPRINGHVGRDHWPEAWSMAMAGCGLRRGIAVGETDEEGVQVASEPYDIGHLFHTWFTALGLDSTRTEYDNDGQPLPIAHGEMRAVAELLA